MLKHGKLTFQFNISSILFLAISFFLLFGRMQYGGFQEKGIIFSLIILWLLVCWLSNRRAFNHVLSSNPMLLVLFSIIVRTFCVLISPEGIMGGLQFFSLRFTMLVPMIAFLYYQEALSHSKLKALTVGCTVILLTCVFSILRVIDFDLTTARKLSGGLLSRGYFGSLIDMVLGISISFLAIFGTRKRALQQSNKKKIFVFSVLFFILFIVYGYYTQSFIALAVSFSAIIFEVINPNSDIANRYKGFIIALIAVFILLAYIFLGNIAEWMISISGIFGGSIFETKMKEIGFSIITNEGVGDVSIRIKHLATSFTTFLQHPLFGITHIYGYTVDTRIVGMHSGLDILARYGVIGCIPLLIGEWKYLKLILKRNNFLTSAILIIAVFYELLSGWEHVEGLYALLFLAPALAEVIKGNEFENEV